MKKMMIFAPALLCACGQPASQRQAIRNAPEAAKPRSGDTAPTAPAPALEPAATEHRTSLPEPKGPIDPKSVEAAGQVVQSFGALIEENRLADAARLWGDPANAAAFAKQLHPSTHLEIGELGETEGAAGSIYTTVPVVFYGASFRKPADIILRRVNDVPGSTEAQRRWHIERIDWKAAR